MRRPRDLPPVTAAPLLPAVPIVIPPDPEIEALRQRNLQAMAAWNARNARTYTDAKEN
jgi:hypothetical protein